MAKPVKITANLPPDAVQALRDIAARNDESMTQALKDAISVFSYLDREVTDGSKILIQRTDSRTSRELVFAGWVDQAVRRAAAAER